MTVNLDNYDGSSYLCGTSNSILNQFEFDCGKSKGYRVTISSPDSPAVLKICSVGILSSCDCTQTSFDAKDLVDFGPKIGTMVAYYNSGTTTATVKVGDTVSYVCGSAGTGIDYCGSRVITLITKK